jgi:hypothetical protein
MNTLQDVEARRCQVVGLQLYRDVGRQAVLYNDTALECSECMDSSVVEVADDHGLLYFYCVSTFDYEVDGTTVSDFRAQSLLRDNQGGLQHLRVTA